MDFIPDLGAGLIVIGEHEEAYALILAAIDAQQRAGAFLHMPALLRMKGLILASRSAEEYREAEKVCSCRSTGQNVSRRAFLN